jgi:hypothetical protein
LNCGIPSQPAERRAWRPDTLARPRHAPFSPNLAIKSKLWPRPARRAGILVEFDGDASILNGKE